MQLLPHMRKQVRNGGLMDTNQEALELIEDAADCMLTTLIFFPECTNEYYKKVAGRLFKYIDSKKAVTHEEARIQKDPET